MYPDFLKDAKTFINVIKLGSITAASDETGEHRTTISKRLSRLEEELSVKLIEIVKGKIIQTKEGEYFFASARSLFRDLEVRLNKLNQISDQSSRNINLLANTDLFERFGTDVLSDILANDSSLTMTLRMYTQYQLQNYGSVLRNLFEENDIVGLWENHSFLIDDEKWVIKKRFSTKKSIYASAEYIAKNPDTISNISDISKHLSIVNNYEDKSHWKLKDLSGETHRVKTNIKASVDTFNFQVKFIESGLGIGLIPESIVKAYSTKLKQIFCDYSTEERTTLMLINKASLENKPDLPIVAEEIAQRLMAKNYWK